MTKFDNFGSIADTCKRIAKDEHIARWYRQENERVYSTVCLDKQQLNKVL